jgi:hypothetical protein
MLTGQATPVRVAVRSHFGRLHSFTDYDCVFGKEKAAGEPAAFLL